MYSGEVGNRTYVLLTVADKPIDMARRTSSSSRRLVGELVERVSASPPGAAPGALLAWLSTCVGCDSSVFMPAPDRQTSPTEHNKEQFRHLVKLYVDEPHRYLPSEAKCIQAIKKEGICIDNDVYSSSERRELPFYADIIRPQGITSQLVIGLYFHGKYRGDFYLSRHGPVTRFRSSTVERIRPIIPSLALVEVAAAMLPEPPAGPQQPNLGVREREVARLAVRGLETREIAALLGTSPATVRNQLHTIYRKLDVSNRAELAFVLMTAHQI
jgi:DNA-binding CsgD family transcriptional regulator